MRPAEEAQALYEERGAREQAETRTRRPGSPGPPTGGHRARLRAAQMRRQKREAAEDPQTTEARKLRLEREWTQPDLAARALVARMSVIRFEQRERVGALTARRLARALGVAVERIYGTLPSRSPSTVTAT